MSAREPTVVPRSSPPTAGRSAYATRTTPSSTASAKARSRSATASTSEPSRTSSPGGRLTGTGCSTAVPVAGHDARRRASGVAAGVSVQDPTPARAARRSPALCPGHCISRSSGRARRCLLVTAIQAPADLHRTDLEAHRIRDLEPVARPIPNRSLSGRNTVRAR